MEELSLIYKIPERITRDDVDGENIKYIPRTHNRFAVSRQGAVYSFSSKMCGKRIGSPGAGGYFTANILYADGKRRNTYIHRIVAQCFLTPIPDKPYVHHKNENRTDNRVENLAYCTGYENCNNGNHNYKLSKSIKDYYSKHDKTGNFPIKVAILDVNGALLSIEPSINAAAEYVARETGKNVNSSSVQISKILRGVKGFRTCGGYGFRYVEEHEWKEWTKKSTKESAKENVKEVNIKKANSIEGLEMTNRKFIPGTGEWIEEVKDIEVGAKITNELK